MSNMIMLMGILSGMAQKGIPEYSYSGEHRLVDEGGDNWHLELRTSGTLQFSRLNGAAKLEVLLVGGGGGGGKGLYSYNSWAAGGGGGNGGVLTTAEARPKRAESYTITIGAGGAAAVDGSSTSAFGLSAAGGSAGSSEKGGAAGSVGNGKGGVGVYANYSIPSYHPSWGTVHQNATDGENGTDPWGLGILFGPGGGGAGACVSSSYYTTTKSPASGGSDGGGDGGMNGALSTSAIAPGSGQANKGAGGGGGGVGQDGGAGGSGIVIIRNAR